MDRQALEDERIFSQLLTASALSDGEVDAALSRPQSPEVASYLRMVRYLSGLTVPQPSVSKKWAGKRQLLEAVEAYHSKSPRRGGLIAWLKVAPIGAVAAAVLTTSVAAGAVITETDLVDRPVSQVLSALGVGSEPQSPAAGDGPPIQVPPLQPQPQSPIVETDPGIPVTTPLVDEDTHEVPFDANQHGPRDHAGQGVEPPGHGGQNPGLGADPPGQAGANPGNGVGPSGSPPANPGQGVEPPGQGGESPGQGGGNSGQGGQPSAAPDETESQGDEPTNNSGGSGSSGSPPSKKGSGGKR